MSTALASRSPRFLPTGAALSAPSGRLAPRDNLYRGAFAKARAALQERPVDEVVRELFPTDSHTLALVTRAASSAMTTTTGAAVTPSTVVDLVGSLPKSAASSLIANGFQLSLAGRQSLQLPSVIARPTVAWVAENSPIPVGQLTFGSNDLGPVRKLAIIVAFTGELLASSNAEAITRLALAEACARALDEAMFSADAGTDAKPPGLLNGLTPIAATAGGGETAMISDISAAVGSVLAAGGGPNVAVILNSSAALKLRLTARDLTGLTIFESPWIDPDTLIAVDVDGFCSAFDAYPTFTTSDAVLLHYNDAPTDIGVVTGGSPATAVAAPARSAWQGNCVALRMLLDCAFTVREPGFVSHVTGITWS